MAKEDNLKNWDKGVSGNPKGRPKGSLNRTTIVKKWMEAGRDAKNPLNGLTERLSQEDMLTLAMISKGVKGDVSAYKALMDSLYGAVTQSIKIAQQEQPIFNKLDIDVITDYSPEEDSET